MIKINNPEIKNLTYTLLFYGLFALVIAGINISGEFKSGMCAPNLDVLSILAIGPVSMLFFFGNMAAKFGAKKHTTYSAMFHLFVFIGFLVFLNSGF